MNDTKHTPTPWTIRGPRKPVGRSEEGNRLIVKTETKEHIAEVFQYRNDAHKDEATGLANGEFIVLACNSHAELVGVLANTIAVLHNADFRAECRGDFDDCDCFPESRAILAKAKPEADNA